MALLFCDGFDHYATADIPKKWSTASGGNLTINSLGGRRPTGLPTLRGLSTDFVGKSLGANHVTLISGVAVYFPDLPTTTNTHEIMSFWDGATRQMGVRRNHITGTLSVYRNLTLLATSTYVVPIQSYIYVEFRATFDAVNGSYEVRVNGANVLSATGINTMASANAYANFAYLGPTVGSSGANCYYDDYYLCNTAGSANNDFLGDVRIDTLFPSADGTYSQLATSTGTTHYTLVDESVPSTTDYVSGGVAGLKDSYGFTDLTTTASVLGVQVCSLMYKDDAGARSGANLIRSAGTDLQSATTALSTGPLYNVSMHETDPATSAAWTQAAVNAAEFGPVVAA